MPIFTLVPPPDTVHFFTFSPTVLRLFECPGGLVSGTQESRGEIHLERPNRQWDYPYGWAPHQILAWEGMRAYNRVRISQLNITFSC